MATDILSNVWPEWKIEGRHLGRGSYGTVYKAVRRDHNVESYAAIKVISIPSDQSEVDSLRSEGLDVNATRTYLQRVVNDFVSEIQLMESFKGVQNIVSVEDYKVVEKKDEIGWDIYIRMELLTPLNSYICDKTLSEAEVIKLGVDICTALELCAKRNVIHRDIKPENIFINQFGDFKLGDFGIARKLGNMTSGLSQKGTPNYMAPEVEKGTQYNATVDLYSLGLVLYRFTNKNRLPFLDTESQLLNPNERIAAIRRRMDGEPLPPPSAASPALAQVILCACAHDPKRRFASASAMKNALAHAANGANAGANAPNKAVSVMHAQQAQDPNRTTSVRKVPQAQTPAQDPAQKPTQKQIDTFGKKKKSKAPVIIAALLIVALLAGAGVILLPKLTGKDNGGGGASTKNSERLDTQETDHASSSAHTTATTENPDAEKIATAIQEADALAAEANYEGALARLKTELASYPKDATLLAKEAEYTDALAAQKKEKTLEEAEALANSGDYSGAMAVIEGSGKNYADDTDYKAAHDRYRQSYFSTVKTEAITEADKLAEAGSYLDAIARLKQAAAIIGTDADLDSKKTSYASSYSTDISAKIDAYLTDNDVAAAKALVEKALKDLPNQELLKARKAELDQYKTVSLSTLSPINGGFSWNEGTAKDPFGTSYSNAQNYCICHGTHDSYSSNTYSAEYKIDMEYTTMQFVVSPYSDFGQNASSYVQIYVDGILRYTSPQIVQKTEPYKTPAIDISDAEYLTIVVRTGGYGCTMLSDVTLACTPSFVSELDKGATPITALSSLNGSLPWSNGFPTDIIGNSYSNVQNYCICHGTHNSYSSNTYSAEYYISKKYNSILFNIAPASDFGASASATVKVYANDELVYTSNPITQKTERFYTGDIDISGADYVKIVVEVGGYGCTIISDVLMTNAT